MSAHLTHHAAERGEQHLGLTLSSMQKMADMAFEKGIKHAETAGSLNRFLDKLFLEHRTANNLRIYGETIFLFCGTSLVTVFPLDNKFKATVRKIKAARITTEQKGDEVP